MGFEPTKVPLTVKEFDNQRVGLCAGCGCGCGYILYIKEGKVVDLYGHPADPRGIGSLCTKGITYIQEISENPLRLKGIFLREDGDFIPLDYSQAIEILKNKLSKGRTAFLLGRQAGLEEYIIARRITEDIFVDTAVLDFLPSTIHPTQWKEAKFILSVDAEPVFSEVMSSRWLVDAVESGGYLYCISSRYETLSSKARKSKLLRPDLMVEFLQNLLEPEKRDEEVEFLKRNLFLLRGSLVLFGSNLLSSPFGQKVVEILKGLRKRYRVNYSFVGDLMPFPAKTLEEFFERFEEFDNLVIIGNLIRYFKEEHLRDLKKKFVVSFQIFPNITTHYSHLAFASSMFYERDFINYRHGFGYLLYSPRTLEKEENIYDPYKVLSSVFSVDVDLESFLGEHGIDLQRLREEGETPLKMKDVASVEINSFKIKKGRLFLSTDSTLVEDLGHWNPWTHEMERFQKAYVNPKTAREFGFGHSIEIKGLTFHLQLTENIAEGVLFIPFDYEEFQPFDPGYRVGSFAEKPYYRYEVLL